jgi:GMP synthase (glutamine-hydrolysing)
VSPHVTILKAGSTHPDIAEHHGDFEDWVEAGLGISQSSVQVVDLQQHGVPEDRNTDAVVITGAHEMVTDGQPWVRSAAEWICRAVSENMPILGICYGHQLLAHSLGGRVDYHPEGREVGTVSVKVLPEASRDPLFGVLPPVFEAHCSHAQSVLELPEGAIRLAMSDFEPMQAFRVGSCAWGVQFHPEFTGPVMVRYIEKQRDSLVEQNMDADQLIRDVRESPASAVLERFAAIAGTGRSSDDASRVGSSAWQESDQVVERE